MVASAAHLVDEVLPKRPIRQWVLSVSYPLRYLFATNLKVMSQVLTIVHRVFTILLINRARMTVKSGAQSGSLTLIQWFVSALNLSPHFHMLYLNGVHDAAGYFWPVINATMNLGAKGCAAIRSVKVSQMAFPPTDWSGRAWVPCTDDCRIVRVVCVPRAKNWGLMPI